MKTVTEKLDLKPDIELKSICSPEEMLFFDIETTGLKKETTQVYLIGCVYFSEGSWFIRQWLSQSGRDEEFVLEGFLDLASGYRTLVHFNGDRFDIPYLRYKSQMYQMEPDLNTFHSFDIYAHARVLKKLLGLSGMSQKSIETFLGINRDDQYDGGRLIPVYYEYETTGSEKLEKLLLLHNFDDLQGMLKILPILKYRDMIDGKFSFMNRKICGDVLVTDFRLDTALPAVFDICPGSGIQLYGEGNLLQINTRISDGCARFYFDNVKDYYYLPDQDRVIHKDVAHFGDRKNMKKATRKNCFVRKEGKFIPFFPGWDGKTYVSDDGQDRKLIALEDIAESDRMSIFEDMAKNYLVSIISC